MTNKVFLIASREYVTRVRKKSFIIMTILAPLLIVGFYGFIIYLTVSRNVGEPTRTIYVNDETGQYTNKLRDNKSVSFEYGPALSAEELKNSFHQAEYYAVLNIRTDSGRQEAQLIYEEQPGITIVDIINGQLNKIRKDAALAQAGINQEVLDNINRQELKIETAKYTEKGLVAGSSSISSVIGILLAVGIYLFIFLYGVQVMQGVIEEKTNRIVEVIISSVKPFQLMLGKILGVSLVGLTQFVIWGILILVLGAGVSMMMLGSVNIEPQQIQSSMADQGLGEVTEAFRNYNYTLIIGMFLFYFIAGYLFYGSLFAAIGSAVDNETDKNQFMMPVTLPLVFAFAISQTSVVTSPNSTLAVWLSIIPFTSPVTMMVRLPFGVPAWQLVLSAISMIAGIYGTVWIAARIYRVGILMYGKKPTYRELGKWLFYKG